ncbi:unnamed protein product [Oikopleura dioica]|uniref:Isochorismatase-like domain-containing protein n=1 Tax=Oikopleura dioica TaxID=34765 RepID=E4Y281_OIKDI|nr:unnamed protein product [Oikopleura dioica]
MNSEIYKPGETAIIVVDIQTPFYSGFPGISDTNPDFPDSIRKFLSAAREKGFRICHVNQESLSGKDNWLETWYRKNGRDWSCEIFSGNSEEFAAPIPGEPLFVKHAFDGFTCEQLPKYLERHEIKSVIVVGPGIQIRIANSLYCEKLRKLQGVRFAFASHFRPQIRRKAKKIAEFSQNFTFKMQRKLSK